MVYLAFFVKRLLTNQAGEIIMNEEKFRELVKKADFPLWGDEDWKPEGAFIDWGSNYDKEIRVLADLIVKEMLSLTYNKETLYYNLSEDYFARAMENFRELAKDHFGVK